MYYREDFGQYVITFKDWNDIYVTSKVQEDLYTYYHLCQGSWNKAVPKDLDIHIGQMMAKHMVEQCGA